MGFSVHSVRWGLLVSLVGVRQDIMRGRGSQQVFPQEVQEVQGVLRIRLIRTVLPREVAQGPRAYLPGDGVVQQAPPEGVAHREGQE